MSRATLIPLLVTVILPLLWLFAEFRAQKTFRMALGIIAFLCSLAMIFLMAWVTKIGLVQNNSEAVHAVLEASISELEDGRVERTLYLLRDLNRGYKPVTRVQENYLNSLNETAALLTNAEPLDPNILANTPFAKESWSGYWQSDSGRGFLIHPNYSQYDIYRDRTAEGVAPVKMASVSVSEDFKKLQFQESDLYRYTLTLENKYQAGVEIYHLDSRKTEKIQTLRKLVLPTAEQMKYTTLTPGNKEGAAAHE